MQCNAGSAILTPANPSAHVGNLGSFNPVDEALDALDLSSAPSLKGWPMPMDTVSVDGSGDILASGGDLIE
jgi:hypothetical protein